MAWDVGTRLTSELTLLEPLAEGAMGELWVAEHAGLGQKVAVKFLSPKLVSDKAARGRFRREAEAAMQLRSPYIVRLYGHGTTDGGQPFLVFELLVGESLGTLLVREDRLDLGDTLRLVRQVGSALGEAHGHGIVHRDIKADNVFVVDTPSGPVAKVLDFGMAKRTQVRSGSVVTATGVIVGTPEYMSPEQVLGSKQLDHRTDLWSLGVLTYRTLLGAMPFEAEGPGELVFAICRGQFRRPSELYLPKALDEWFERALAPELDARFPSASELVLALERLEATPDLAESIEAGLRALPTVLRPPVAPWRTPPGGGTGGRGKGPGSLSSAARRRREELPLAKTVASPTALDGETEDRFHSQQTVARAIRPKDERRTQRYLRPPPAPSHGQPPEPAVQANDALPASVPSLPPSVPPADRPSYPAARPSYPVAAPPSGPSVTLPSHGMARPAASAMAARRSYPSSGPPNQPPLDRPSHPSSGPPSHPPAARPSHPSSGPPSHPPAARPSYPSSGPPSHPPAARPSYPSSGSPSHPGAPQPAYPVAAPSAPRSSHLTVRLGEIGVPAGGVEEAPRPSERALPPWMSPAAALRGWPGSKGVGGPTLVLGVRDGADGAAHRKLGYGTATLVVVAIAASTALGVGAMVLASLEAPTAGMDHDAEAAGPLSREASAPASRSAEPEPTAEARVDGSTTAEPTATAIVERTGYLAIDCRPGCSQVIVDGRSLGPSPIVGAELRPGRRQVTLKRRGLEPQVEEIEIVAGRVTRRLFVTRPAGS